MVQGPVMGDDDEPSLPDAAYPDGGACDGGPCSTLPDAAVDRCANAAGASVAAQGAACRPGSALGVGAPLALLTSLPGSPHTELRALSADERTALSTPWPPEGDVVLYVSDRTSATEPFGAPTALDASLGIDPTFVALTADGSGFVAVDADGRRFVMVSRASRGEPFLRASTDAFSLFDGQPLPAGQTYAYPVLSGSGRTFAYSVIGSSSTSLRISVRSTTNDPFPIGTTPTGCALQDVGTFIRVPTGLSADDRTLFFWDTERQVARTAFAASAGTSFDYVVDLGGPRSFVTPSADCARLYVNSYGVGDVDARLDPRL